MFLCVYFGSSVLVLFFVYLAAAGLDVTSASGRLLAVSSVYFWWVCNGVPLVLFSFGFFRYPHRFALAVISLALVVICNRSVDCVCLILAVFDLLAGVLFLARCACALFCFVLLIVVALCCSACFFLCPCLLLLSAGVARRCESACVLLHRRIARGFFWVYPVFASAGCVSSSRSLCWQVPRGSAVRRRLLQVSSCELGLRILCSLSCVRGFTWIARRYCSKY